MTTQEFQVLVNTQQLVFLIEFARFSLSRTLSMFNRKFMVAYHHPLSLGGRGALKESNSGGNIFKVC